MLYGEELFILESLADSVSPFTIHQSPATIWTTKPLAIPLILRAMGFRVTTAIDYMTPTTIGVLTLFAQPFGETMLAFTGGSYAPPMIATYPPGANAATVTGATSGATAKVVGLTGTWGVSGTLFLINKVGNFAQGETLNFVSAYGLSSCVNAQPTPYDAVAAQVSLATMSIPDLLPVGQVVWNKIPNIPPDTNPMAPGPADMNVGDVLVYALTTEPVGSTYNTGAIQPFLLYHNRGENEGNMPGLLDVTLPIVGV